MWNRLLVAVAVACFGTGAVRGQEGLPPSGTVVSEVSLATPVYPAAMPETIPLTLDALMPSRFWVRADYLFAWINGPANSATLLTTAPPNTERLQAGVLDDPRTSVLFGASPTAAAGFNEAMRPGFRLTTGMFFHPQATVGGEMSFLMLGSRSVNFAANSDGNSILARPYRNAVSGAQEAVLVAFPEVSAGQVDFRVASGNFYNGTAGLFETFCNTGTIRLDSLLGYRFYRYDEAFRVRQTVNVIDPNFVAGTQIVTRDDFSAQNEFHGVEIGLRAELALTSSIDLHLLAKVAGGNLRREVQISGAQQVFVPGNPALVERGGFLALESNSGRHVSNEFMAVPEFGAGLSLRATPNLRFHVGYNGILLCRAASVMPQVDTVLDPSLLPPATRPAVGGDRPRFQLQRDNIWIQSIELGMEWIW
ncbi:MAG: BBP7 family outer membrane beta-barrel protein [Gemmataceae bacterium]